MNSKMQYAPSVPAQVPVRRDASVKPPMTVTLSVPLALAAAFSDYAVANKIAPDVCSEILLRVTCKRFSKETYMRSSPKRLLNKYRDDFQALMADSEVAQMTLIIERRFALKLSFVAKENRRRLDEILTSFLLVSMGAAV